MSRRQWTGLAGVLFGAAMLSGVLVAGSTPNSDRSGAAERYAKYWNDSGHQDHALLSAIFLSYACVLLLAFAVGLSRLLRRQDDGGTPTFVAAAGATAAALLGVGSNLLSAVGASASENSYAPDGNTALLIENTGYFTLSFGMMAAAAAVVAFSWSNRKVRVVPQWTIVLGAILGLVGLGGMFTAWFGFLLLPLWSVVIGVCLLAIREPVVAEG